MEATMNVNQFSEKIAEGKLTRREISKILASAGIAAVAIPVTTRRSLAASEATFMTWAGFDQPQYYVPYVEKHGVPPGFSLMNEEEEGLQKVRAGFRPDAANICLPQIQRWYDSGFVKPINTSRVEHWNDLFPELVNTKEIHHDGEVWAAPFIWGNSSVLYRTDMVDIAEESFTLLLDERYKGKVAIYDGPDAWTAIGGLLTGAGDPFDMTDDEIERMRVLWRELIKQLRFTWSDPSVLAQALASGEVVVAWGWNDTYQQLRREGVPVKFMWTPTEGIMTWYCALMLVDDGAAPEEKTYDFLNAVLDPRSGKAVVEEVGYGHSNRKTFDLLSEETMDGLGLPSDISAFLAKGNWFRSNPPATREKLINYYNELLAEAGQ
jgi:spermidine/putrescine transport system substrate-binding protein